LSDLFVFGSGVVQLDPIRNARLRIEQHRPGQLGDLAGAQSGFDR
jgi:hypothetical protein